MQASLGPRLLLLAMIAAAPWPLEAEEHRFDLGLRANFLTGDGEPTNDVPSYGLIARVPLGEHWSLGLGLDHSPEFDVERTAKIVGFEQSGTEEEIDSIGTSSTLSAWMERHHGDRFQWLWGAGLGIADVDVDPLEGRRSDGSPFRVVTDAGSELLLVANGGFRYWLGARKWAVSTQVRLEQHWSSWELRDEVSGDSATIDDYYLTGIHFGLSRRF